MPPSRCIVCFVAIVNQQFFALTYVSHALKTFDSAENRVAVVGKVNTVILRRGGVVSLMPKRCTYQEGKADQHLSLEAIRCMYNSAQSYEMEKECR